MAIGHVTVSASIYIEENNIIKKSLSLADWIRLICQSMSTVAETSLVVILRLTLDICLCPGKQSFFLTRVIFCFSLKFVLDVLSVFSSLPALDQSPDDAIDLIRSAWLGSKSDFSCRQPFLFSPKYKLIQWYAAQWPVSRSKSMLSTAAGSKRPFSTFQHSYLFDWHAADRQMSERKMCKDSSVAHCREHLWIVPMMQNR